MEIRLAHSFKKEVYVDTTIVVALSVGGYFLSGPLVAPLVWRIAAFLGRIAIVGSPKSLDPEDDIRFDEATGGGMMLLALGWIAGVFFIAVFGFISFIRLLGWIGMKISGQ